jgi:hypothetical protein
MAEVIHDDKILIYFFHDSLIGSTKIKKWKDLTNVFLKKYKSNLEIVHDRTSLMAIEKGNQESVRVYAQRWRDAATHVQPPLIEEEIVMLFTNTFKSSYYEHLIGSLTQHFNNVDRIIKRIEQGIKFGSIVEPVVKKGFARKKRENNVKNLESGYKSEKANYHNSQTHTSQNTSINFAKPFCPNQTN